MAQSIESDEKCARCKTLIAPSPLELCGECEEELKEIFEDIFQHQPK